MYHADFHPGNAICDGNDHLWIIDWDEARIGFPMDSIYWLDTIATSDEWEMGGGTRSVKSVYLESIPWNSAAERERAWELGHRLARIVSAYENLLKDDALHRDSRTGGNTASLLINALEDWESNPE